MKDSPPINTTIYHYRVFSKLGAGKMGEVCFLVKQRRLDEA
jgi:hypothetical protein